MAISTFPVDSQSHGAPPPGALEQGEGRRILANPGLIVVVTALISAVGSFVILMGLTPIAPRNEVVMTAVIVNLVFVLALLGLIAYEIRRVFQARQLPHPLDGRKAESYLLELAHLRQMGLRAKKTGSVILGPAQPGRLLHLA